MATTDTHTIPSGARTNIQVASGCSACAHPWTAHDQIATRFCAATAAARHNRGCVCTVHPSTRTRDRLGPHTG